MDKLSKDERKAQRKEEWQQELQKEQQRKTLTKIAWIAGSIVVIIVAFWAIINFTGSAAQNQSLITKMPPVTKSDIQTGPANSPVTLVEYADFQCPACGAYYPLVEQVRGAFKGKIHFVYRTFPLTNLHPNAMAAAEAAVAANHQGQFWLMYSDLYQHQNDWAGLQNPQPNFDEYAQQMGLNIDKFHKDMANPKTKTFIMSEENGGLHVGVDATPTFFVNGKQIANPQSIDTFKQVIQDAFNGKPS